MPVFPETMVPSLALKTPAEHGDFLLRPSPAEILEVVSNGPDFFAQHHVEWMGRTLGDWRLRTRREILADAVKYTQRLGLPVVSEDPARPLIVTGHQCQFFHGGIFIKYLLGRIVAQSCGGIFLNLMVDTDLPKQTALELPPAADDEYALQQIDPMALRSDQPLESQELPSEDCINKALDQLEHLSLPDFLKRRKSELVQIFRGAFRMATTPAEWFALVNHRIAAACGNNGWLELPVSRMAQTDGFAIFVIDMLLQATKVHDVYNRSLDRYRQDNHVRNAARPVPDLRKPQPDTWELPFWVIRPGAARAPLFVQVKSDTLTLRDHRQELGTLDCQTLQDAKECLQYLYAFCREQGLGLRPRALTLSMFARLFLGDLFIHGIGGGRYDEVTDLFIRNYYRMPSPPFVVASATLHLSPTDARSQEELLARSRGLQRRQRDLQFNPQRFMSQAQQDHGRDLLAERLHLIEENNMLRQQQLQHGNPCERRRAIFLRLHELNRLLRADLDKIAGKTDADRELVRKRLQRDKSARHREYFIGLFDPTALRDLQNNLEKAFAGAG